MRCPTELYTASSRPYDGLPELQYPWHDRDILVTACGRICLHRKKINISTVLAGQKLGIKEVDDGIWLFSFMHYDLGDRPTKTDGGRGARRRFRRAPVGAAEDSRQATPPRRRR